MQLEHEHRKFTKRNTVHPILEKLQGGDRRSIGRADEVVDEILSDTDLFKTLISGFFVGDPVIRMRTADVVEKTTRVKPELLRPYKNKLIRLAGETEQQEVRWHLAQILPRLSLKSADHNIVIEILFSYLDDKSKIVITFALQALADFAGEDPKLKPRVIRALEDLTRTGSPAIKTRGRKLLKMLQN